MQRMTTAEERGGDAGRSTGSPRCSACPACTTIRCSTRCIGAQDRIRLIHPRHEQTAAYMALGAALATGRPQAFAAVPGPGVLNSGAALLTAWGMEAPVLALAGQIPSHAIDRGYGHLHEIPDQLGLLRHLTKHAARITGPHEASARVANAICLALSGRRRPVALECAIDVWNRAGPAPLVGPIPPVVPPVDHGGGGARGAAAGRGEAAADHGGRRRPGCRAGGAGAGRDAGGAGRLVSARARRDPDRRIGWRCPTRSRAGSGRRRMWCSASAPGCTRSRASGGWNPGCRSSGWTSIRRSPTASAGPTARSCGCGRRAAGAAGARCRRIMRSGPAGRRSWRRTAPGSPSG